MRDSGTYEFGTFPDNAGELERLRLQAEKGLVFERKLWGDTGLRPGHHALDLGSGPGLIASEMAKLNPSGTVLGVDLNEPLLAEAEALRARQGLTNLLYLKASAYELPLQDNSIDYVYSRFLFQHLAHPALALENIFRVMKPGARLCILDTDDQYLTLWPEPVGFAEFTACAVEAQCAMGGNRYIGRELFHLLTKAGFTNCRTQVHVMTTDDWGKRAFLDITTRFKTDQIMASPHHRNRLDPEAALASIYKFVNDPTGWGATGVFMGIAEKPMCL